MRGRSESDKPLNHQTGVRVERAAGKDVMHDLRPAALGYSTTTIFRAAEEPFTVRR